jgi:opacity protein-like surface antigen
MFKALAAAAATAVVLSCAVPAIAADLMVDTPPVVEATGFDWEGAYVGSFLGVYPTFGPSPTVGGEIGYNFVPSESFLLGVEGSGLFYLDGSAGIELFVHGKAGATFDNVAVYGLAGVGTFNFGTFVLWDVGVGAEVAVTDNLTLDAQVFGRNVIGSAPTVPHVQAGIRYHF